LCAGRQQLHQRVRKLAIHVFGGFGRTETSVAAIAGDPKATVEFVSGPGLYMVQLTVTDAKGHSAKSPVAMLNDQP